MFSLFVIIFNFFYQYNLQYIVILPPLVNLFLVILIIYILLKF